MDIPVLFSEMDVTVVRAEQVAEPRFSDKSTIVHGDAVEALKRLPSGLVQMIVTSPPYFGQRDYDVEEQIGNESDVELYLERLVTVFRECRRVLGDDGTLWLNIGDKYLKSELLGIPWRLAFALKQDGWVLRSDIIWYKPNAMPSSVKTRPTTDHEYLFLFSKGRKYYYDSDAIREPHVTFTERSRMYGGRRHFGKRGGTPEKGKNAGNSNLHTARWDQAFHPKGRNKRTVWEVPLSKFRDAHFAVFPEKLVEPCILAGSAKGAIVLDPFCGTGTAGVISLKHQRRFIGLEISQRYCEMATRRLLTSHSGKS